MDEIATEAGVARSTLYVYFANRDELLRACLQRMHDLLLDAVVAVLGARRRRRWSGSARSWSACSSASTTTPPSSGWRWPPRVCPARWASTVGAELDLIGLDIAGLIRDVIEQGTRSGDVPAARPDKATTFVGQQLYGAMSVRAGDPRPAPVEEAADELCTFLLHGLAGPARREPHPDTMGPVAQGRGGRPGVDGRAGHDNAGDASPSPSPRASHRRHPATAPGPHRRGRSLLLRQHGGGVPLAAPPRRAPGTDAPGTTNAATPWPVWPWGWRAWWRPWWGPSCWRRSRPGGAATARRWWSGPWGQWRHHRR